MVGTVALACRVALALVLGVSSAAKASDRAGTAQAVVGFGVPRSLVRPAALALPVLEAVAAIGSLLDATATAGLVLALLLLVAFTVAVAVVLRSGRIVECHCFGRLGAVDVSGRTLVRNGVLLALAVLGLVMSSRGDASGRSVPAGVLVGAALAGAVLAGEVVAGRSAVRRRESEADDQLHQVLADQPVADLPPAPPFRADQLTGSSVALADLLDGARPLLLVSLSPGCGPCETLRPAVAHWARTMGDRVAVAVVGSGGHEANAEAYGDLPPYPVLLDDAGHLRDLYDLRATPSAALIDAGGRLRGSVAGGDRVRRLYAAALSGAEIVLSDATPDGSAWPGAALDSVVARGPAALAPEADGSTTLVDAATGATVLLDPVGSMVWSVLDGSSTLDAIVADIVEVYGAPHDVVATDVVALVDRLGQAGLVTLTPPRGGA